MKLLKTWTCAICRSLISGTQNLKEHLPECLKAWEGLLSQKSSLDQTFIEQTGGRLKTLAHKIVALEEEVARYRHTFVYADDLLTKMAKGDEYPTPDDLIHIRDRIRRALAGTQGEPPNDAA